jgi:hypothetical protein
VPHGAFVRLGRAHLMPGRASPIPRRASVMPRGPHQDPEHRSSDVRPSFRKPVDRFPVLACCFRARARRSGEIGMAVAQCRGAGHGPRGSASLILGVRSSRCLDPLHSLNVECLQVTSVLRVGHALSRGGSPALSRDLTVSAIYSHGIRRWR